MAKSAEKAKGPQTIVGVDLGGSKILARLFDASTGRASGRVKFPTPTDGPKAVISRIVEAVNKLDGWENAAGIGIGVPGPVTPDGIAGPCPNIAGWDKPIAIAEKLNKQLGKPVVASNDVNCGAVAEHRVGAGIGHDDLLAIFVGTGIGGGLILNNQLIVGQRGLAGEIGHVTVEVNGRPCGCGQFGHLETYAGRAGMDAEMRRRSKKDENKFLMSLVGQSPIKSRHLAAGLEADDPLTRQLVEDAANALALVIGNQATLLDLPIVILGGGIVDRLGPSFLEQIRQSSHFGGAGRDVTELVLARRLDDAGAVGAALIAGDALSSR